MPDPHRILIIRPSALGDLCRTAPVLASLRHALPNARLDWLVQDTFADAIADHPALDHAIHFRRSRLGKEAARGGVHGIRVLADRLREAKYDLVIDAQGLFRSGWLAWVSGARWRIGHAEAREGAWAFYTHRVRTPRDMHTVDRMLALVEAVGIRPVRDMRLFLGDAPRREADRVLADARGGAASIRGGPIVLAPTTRWPGKRWPDERWVELATRLMERGRRIAVVGGPGERDQCPQLASLADEHPRALNAIGSTSVGGLMALIERAPLVVALDSATTHMAVGLARPLVALYGPTDVRTVGPYARDADVIQHLRPADRLDHKNEARGRELMHRIGVDEVFAACEARV